jgi:hypothetical protein
MHQFRQTLLLYWKSWSCVKVNISVVGGKVAPLWSIQLQARIRGMTTVVEQARYQARPPRCIVHPDRLAAVIPR